MGCRPTRQGMAGQCQIAVTQDAALCVLRLSPHKMRPKRLLDTHMLSL